MAEIDFEKLGEQISSATESIGKMVDVARGMMSPNSSWRAKIQPQPLYKKTSGDKTGSVFQMAAGFSMAGLGGIIASFGALMTAVRDPAIGALVWGFLLIAGGLTLGLFGLRKNKKIQRFREYVAALENRTWIEVPSLAAKTGRSPKYVKSDLEDMIDERLFLQGHLGQDGSMLITSDETYRNYLSALETQRQAAKAEEANDELLSALSESERAIIREGERYLVKIKEANNALPGVVISAKLYRLEQVIRRIIDEVKKRPGSVGDLRKLMNYYLPTTWKLLESYQEIEREPYKTQQMITTQEQIEKTIDTVNDAFEKLLDELFRDTAWDINSDISVLNTMLVQEGLKDAEMSIQK
ncbi:MAG: 5-bromo-4-chloroindolyl phosphate hydrolysis family protein [Lachnospiraceae bacterium]|nr:5-bromo-4-chloroindolyl phosphate hydrolysis family protein [Lachnospiraceae bacterium]